MITNQLLYQLSYTGIPSDIVSLRESHLATTEMDIVGRISGRNKKIHIFPVFVKNLYFKAYSVRTIV